MGLSMAVFVQTCSGHTCESVIVYNFRARARQVCFSVRNSPLGGGDAIAPCISAGYRVSNTTSPEAGDIRAREMSPILGWSNYFPIPRAYARGYSMMPLQGMGSCGDRQRYYFGQLHIFTEQF